MDYTGRFAPSPTGALHQGSLLTALASWLDARHHQGRWLLRIEDIDPPREVAGSADVILRDLDRLGLAWDGEPLYQSRRQGAYAEALTALIDAGLAYPCRCSRRDIQAMHPHIGPEGPVYPGHCRRQPARPGQGAAWRVLTEDVRSVFPDRIQGPQHIELGRDLGDFVIRRADGLWAYHLAVVIDDAHQGVTDILRGADLLRSSARHRHLQTLLGLPQPQLAHLPLLCGADGRKLSKQTGATALDLRHPGQALVQALTRLGQVPPRDGADDPQALLAAAVRDWDIGRVPRRLPACTGA